MPHVNRTYEKIPVLMYVVIHRPRAHHAHTCMQIGAVKIVSVDCLLLRVYINVAHQTIEA